MVGVHGAFQDLSEVIARREQAAAELELQEERFRLVSQATRDVIYDWDLDTDSVWWSESMAEQFGHDAQALSGGKRGLKSLIHPDDADRIDTQISAALAQPEQIWQGEYRLKRAGGGYASVIDRFSILRADTGKPQRVIGSISDVTAIRETQANLHQAQKMEAVGQLTGGVAHYFNNLLTVILGNAELLNEQLENTDTAELAQTISLAATRGAELTNRLLAFARRQTLEPSVMALGQVLRDMKGLLRRTLTENIDIRIDVGDDLWPVEIDPVQFEVSVLNLAINARDAMPDGGCLTIEADNRELDEDYADEAKIEPGKYVCVAVSDTGS